MPPPWPSSSNLVTTDSTTTVSLQANGGTATSSADGGTIEIGDVNSGGNAGNVIEVGV